MIQARLCSIWRWPSQWAGTASLMLLCCGRNRVCSGRVASDPTVSRLFTTLAADAPTALRAITNTRGRQLADLELRHRRRARCEDRIRICKDTGLTNLPLHGFAQNQLWLAVVSLAVELTAWLQMLAFTDHPARRWDPNGFGCACSRPPAASSATPEPADSGSPRTPPGDTSSRPPSPGSKHSQHPADQHQPAPTTPHHHRNCGTRQATPTEHPGRTSTPTDRTEDDNQPHDPAHASTSGPRKICECVEASDKNSDDPSLEHHGQSGS
jgi:hypothetical protein